ncbi:enhancer of mRNA-decapping protein 3 [[Candida] railenensis]|uniref:Enhancer of mRNA-decapping protein 3 n=1 Tax=[Candida] railenensis TaxID=45579 RepID=A0A9P0QUV1_9ASCO|nr:enhancer of mRNA-decapping protein 3 [[Candida] railenensis]
MAEFLNYQVNLTLRDGSSSSGTIVHVDKSSIVLSGNSAEPINIESSKILDLKVIQLPQDLIKGLKKKKKQSEKQQQSQQQQQSQYQSNELLDDAIVFAKKPNSSAQGSVSVSRVETPKLKNIKPSQNPSSSSSSNWGKESDIQEIKSSNEFDFAANLAMFDKKSVFADFQRHDTVSPGDRLVGHNKLPNGEFDSPSQSRDFNTVDKEKVKYGNDEMVLDSMKVDNWDMIGSTTSKNNSKNAQGNNGRSMSTARGGTPVLNDEAAAPPLKRVFKLVHGESREVVPLCSPVQLLEVERISAESYGITPSLMTEVASVNLSQLILSKMLGGSNRLSNKKNHNLPPLVLLLIGSGRCGARAFATGRHLTNHGVRVLAFVVNANMEEEDDSSNLISKQWELFEMAGGKVITSNFNQLLNIINKELDTPVELIIDALQGYDDHLEDIFFQEKDLQTLKEIIHWCNESLQHIKTMSLDIPSGIDGGSGTVSDFGLYINCRWCISMGLPITGLIHAYKNNCISYGTEGEVLHYLIDTGIPNKVFSSRGNLRKFEKFWYSSGYGIKLQLSVE